MSANKKKVLILGGTGMLGSMLVDVGSKDTSLHIIATRQAVQPDHAASPIQWVPYTHQRSHSEGLKKLIESTSPEVIINAIGLIKHKMSDSSQDNLNAISINSELPITLSSIVGTSAQIITICTDCVYAGDKGNYIETDRHDAEDMYGKTKSIGEFVGNNTQLLRCSIIGPEQSSFKSLLEWVRRQPQGATIKGFTNHHWNGVTTLHFAKLCYGLIKKSLPPSPLQHVIPADSMTKAQLVAAIAHAYQRDDITIVPQPAQHAVDRTLSTLTPERNKEFWQLAGYSTVPTLSSMITELAAYPYGDFP